MTPSEHLRHGSARHWAAILLVAVAILGAGPGVASATSCANGDAEPDAMSATTVRRATLCLLNAERRSRGLAPLRLSRRLSAAARRHSRDMVRRRYFSHTAPGGSGLLQRIRRSGYLRSAHRWRLGENLAWGSRGRSSAYATVQAWMHSPPHRHAILTPSYRDAGIGVALGVPQPGPARGATYTADFGAKR
jgi:uncharacterized protein YkwD